MPQPRLALVLLGLLAAAPLQASAQETPPERPRARDLGLEIGIFPTGPLNAITDVAGVRVGQTTIIEDPDVRTGVTAIVPAPGDLFAAPVPARIHVGNGYGKLVGATQVNELGEIETPILLTCTTCVWRAADALKNWVYEAWPIGQRTVNPIVGETNDGGLNNQWRNPVTAEHIVAALDDASAGPVAEGSVGAGTGTAAFAFKGGIGTSSRVLPEALGGWTVGVLVQTNFGGNFTLDGLPLAERLGLYPYRELLPTPDDDARDGSIMIVVATNAPLDPHQLGRLAARPMLGLGRTGSWASNGSGDYVIAFSAHPDVRVLRDDRDAVSVPALPDGALSPIFAATIEATEEAIYNAILKATTVESSRGRLEAIDLDAVNRALTSSPTVDEG